MEAKNDSIFINTSLSIELIMEPETALRTEYPPEEMEELANSIKKVGLVNPLTVELKNDKYILSAGSRRLRACKALKMEKVDVRVFKGSAEMFDQIMIDENYARVDTSIVEEAFFLETIKQQHKLTQKALAKRIGKSEAFISERIKITRFLPDILNALDQKQITLKIAFALNNCRNMKEIDGMLEYTISNNATEQMVKQWVKEVNDKLDALPDGDIEAENINPQQAQTYQIPVMFCDICKEETDHMNSNFIRCCTGCLKVAQVNLGPGQQEQTGQEPVGE